MIRQAISCDVCGAEKKQTNHWFVAYDQSDELRVCAFNSRTRLKSGSKHLCGQACLHKLVDEFISNALGGRVAVPGMEAEESGEQQRAVTDTSLTSKAAYRDSALPQKSIPAAALIPTPRIATPVPAAVVAMQPRPVVEQPRPVSVSSNMAEAINYTSRHWRAEAWEREREREMRASPTPRRKSS